MEFLLESILKDLRRMTADRSAILIWLGIPFMIGTLMTVATGGSGGPSPKAKLFVVDEDQGLLSGLVVGALGRAGGVVEAEEVPAEEGLARMESGEGSGMITLPEGFSEALLKETPMELVLLTNPSQRILPGILAETFSMLEDLVFYGHRLFGDELKELVEAGESEDFDEARVAALSVKIQRATERISTTLFPPVIQLVVREPEPAGGVEGSAGDAQEEEDDGPVTFGSLVLPGVLFMSLFFMAMGLAEDIWRERKAGTLKRIGTTPQPPLAFLYGKLGASALMVAGVSGLALLAMAIYLGIPMLRLPVAWLWCVGTGLGILSVFFAIQLMARNQRAANMLGNMLTFPLLMLGGSFFPFGAMPEWMASAGRLTPNGWALDGLIDILGGHASMVQVGTGLVFIAAFTSVFLFLSATRMRAVYAKG